MDLNVITQTAATQNFIPQTETNEQVISSDFETFLRMLTVQMENQDPLNPTDSAEFAMQLATFSSVEQQVLTNDLITTLTTQINTTGMAQMADWVGKEARAPMPAYFDGSPITIAPNPASAADKVELVVYNAAGEELSRSEIPKSTDPIEWAGVAGDGTPYAEGIYQFRVVSSSNAEVILDETPDVYGLVQEVRSENGEAILMMEGGIPVAATEATALRRTD